MKQFERILLDVSLSPEIDRGIILVAAQRISAYAVDGLGIAHASIWLIDASADEISCLTGFPDEESTENDQVFRRNDCAEILEPLQSSRVLALNDISNSDHRGLACLEYFRSQGSRALLLGAIRYRGDLIGVLHCADGGLRDWSKDECEFAANLADMVGRALSAQRWQSAEDALQTANLFLEERVALRTRELSETLERLQLTQDQLVESEKMASLGGLVAGVAHEINTPIGICITSLSHLKTRKNALEERYKAGSITEGDLENMLGTMDEVTRLLENQLQRTARLVKSFKQVAVDQSIDEINRFDLNSKLDELMLSLRHELKVKSVSMTVECPQDLKITTYPGALDQVLTNLTMNSLLHGFGDQERGNITVRVTQLDQRVLIRFSDDGAGIPEEHVEKIFEPFFTTRRNRGGTGLGLHILYNLVSQKMKGSVKLDSSHQRGACFLVELPLAID